MLLALSNKCNIQHGSPICASTIEKIEMMLDFVLRQHQSGYPGKLYDVVEQASVRDKTGNLHRSYRGRIDGSMLCRQASSRAAAFLKPYSR
jgi:hypothetical protein